MTEWCDHCFGRGHSPILRQPENDYSEHSMPDDPYYCACPRGVSRMAWETKGIVLDGVTASEGTVMGIDREAQLRASSFDGTGFEVGEAWYLVDGEWSRDPPQQVTCRVWGKVKSLSRTVITFDTGPAITNGEVVPGNRRERRAAKARARHRK